jgi:putative Mg2+ transporter-C (MgtC) family protein
MHAWGAMLLTAAQQSENIKVPSHWDAVGRIALAWVLTFALGFERQLRGAMAGDRTFSLLGAATALIGVLAGNGANTILAGAVTGIGFIGGGLCFRQTVAEHEVLHGVTTAASIFACAAIGAGCGLGLARESIAATLATLLTLELRHIPLLRALDARRWTGLLLLDDHIHEHFVRRNGGTGPGAEARVATAATSDTDSVVLINPVTAAQQAASGSAATVEPDRAIVGAGTGDETAGEEVPAQQ